MEVVGVVGVAIGTYELGREIDFRIIKEAD
jgi:hypothetical protein